MEIHSYFGGIYLKAHTELSKTSEIVSLVPKDDMVYPLIPYRGKCPSACVEVGDKVKIGQQIAKAKDGTLGIYSSVSGVVKAIERRRNHDLKMYKSIVVENDGYFEEGEFDEVVDLEQLEFIQVINLIGAYGIREYTKGNVSLYEKLKRTNSEHMQYVIINGVECEPYLTSIYRRFIDDPDMIIDGIKVMRHLFPKALIVVAIGDDKMDAVIEMEKKVKTQPNVEVITVNAKYPSGEPCRLIYQVTGKMFDNDLKALSEGIFCIQADTLCALSDAVFEGVPPMSRVLTVSGNECEHPGNYEVLFGTSIEEVIRLAGGEKHSPYMVVAGGPFKGNIIEDLSVPVTSSLEGIILLSKEIAAIYEPSECIRCGRCVAVCPNRLVPEKLLNSAVNEKTDEFLKWHGDCCTMCGCCSYVCPSNIPLTGYIGEMKDKLKYMGE